MEKDGVNIPNENLSKLTSIKNAGIYSLELKQGNCSSISNGITFTKVDTIKLIHKIHPLYSNNICNDMATLVYVEAPLEGINLSVIRNGVFLKSIATNNPYFEINQTGKYLIKGTAQGCVILQSDTINVVVGNKLKPVLYDGRNFLCGGDSTFLELSYPYKYFSSNITYQWYKNNQQIVNATNSKVTIKQPGFYKLKLSSGTCTGFSDSVEIKSVTTLPKPKIYNRNEQVFMNIITPNYFCTNSFIHIDGGLKLIGDEIAFDSLFWKKNGLIFAKKSGYHVVDITQPGIYTVVGKQGTCESESDPVEIKIGEPITANITGSTSIYPGQSAKLNMNFTGGNAWFYQTSDVPIGQTTSFSPLTKNVKPTATQSYSITSVASNCGVGTVTGNATVTVLPCPTDKTFSVNSGNWNVPATWTCGQIPSPIHDAVIEKEHTVSLPNSYQGETKKLDLKGTLKQGVGSGVRVY
jgi:trimeric autotransporter adhesin